MPNKLVISLAEYANPPDCGYVMSSKDYWGDFWRKTDSAGAAPNPPLRLENAISNIEAGSFSGKLYIHDLSLFLVENDKDFKALEHLFAVTQRVTNTSLEAWISVGKYWQLKHKKKYEDVLRVFGNPIFAPRSGEINKKHGGFEPLSREWARITTNKDVFVDRCNERNSACRKSIRESSVLNNIFDDLQSCGGVTLLNRIIRGKKPFNSWASKDDKEVFDLLLNIGIVKINGGEEWLLTSEILRIVIQEKSFWWKLTNWHLGGIGKSFLIWLVNLWSNTDLLIRGVVLLTVVVGIVNIIKLKEASADAIYLVRYIDILFLTMFLGLSWRISHFSLQAPSDLGNKKYAAPIASIILLFYCLVSLIIPIQITQPSGFHQVEKILYDDWLFSDDRADISIYTNKNRDCEFSIETSSTGGLATNPCKVDDEGDVYICPLNATSIQGGKPKVDVIVSCGYPRQKGIIPLRIYRFMLPLGVRQYSTSLLGIAALIVIIPAFFSKEKNLFGLLILRPKELFWGWLIMVIASLFIVFVF